MKEKHEEKKNRKTYERKQKKKKSIKNCSFPLVDCVSKSVFWFVVFAAKKDAASRHNQPRQN